MDKYDPPSGSINTKRIITETIPNTEKARINLNFQSKDGSSWHQTYMSYKLGGGGYHDTIIRRGELVFLFVSILYLSGI